MAINPLKHWLNIWEGGGGSRSREPTNEISLARAHEEDMVGAPALEKMLTGQDQLLLVYRRDIVLLLLYF
jgi:hypothetical protein